MSYTASQKCVLGSSGRAVIKKTLLHYKIQFLKSFYLDSLAICWLPRILILAFLLLFPAFSPSITLADELNEEIKQLENFSNVFHLIKRRYVKNQTTSDLIRNAIQGMIKSLDPYSVALTKEELENLELQSVGQYTGIGVTIQYSEKKFIITQVFENSPASKLGIKPGDVIVQIDGKMLGDISEEELNQLIIGEKGTKLNVGFYSAKNPDRIVQKKIVRDLVKVNSVECFDCEHKIAIIRIHQFLKHTPREVNKFLGKRSYEAVVLDLRNNPGGLLVSAVETAEIFISMGDIVQIRDRNDRVIERYVSRRQSEFDSPFLVVLINRFSASAAEILAGAIRDRNEGILVGETSFGKGVVQSVFPVADSLFVKITTAHFFTPSGIDFNGKGIQPDYPVEDTAEQNRYDEKDQIYQKALQLVHEKIGI